ncbi:hypothetical protein F4810DRAFT_711090 [Camillea tinctor]|nr:hypothetical protein F4810DRAFT_711090 [Camillea tinctor]
MIILAFLTFLALMASGATPMPTLAPELIPIRAPDFDKAGLVNIAPSNAVKTITDASKVTCNNKSIEIIFDSLVSFQRSKTQWPENGSFVLITNHLGNCDAQNERGIFLVNGLQWNDNMMQVIANAERKDAHSTASALEVHFGHLATENPSKRAITFDKDDLNMAGSVQLPQDMKIFSINPIFTARTTKGYISDNITFSGHMKYHIHNNYLEYMYFDFDAALTADLGFNLDFTAPLDRNLTYSPDVLQLSSVNIPKIIQLGPSLRWGIGIEVTASTTVSVGANVWAQIPNGHIHLDLVDNTKSHAEGWEPQHEITLGEVSGMLMLGASPFVEFSAELAIHILGGKLDLSAGFRAETKYVNELMLTKLVVIPYTGGDINSTQDQGVVAAMDLDCDSGLAHHTAVDLSLTAFLTEKWEKELFQYQTAVSDTCYR